MPRTPLGDLIVRLRDAYTNGENVMKRARDYTMEKTGRFVGNDLLAVTLSYDSQAGAYIERVLRDPESHEKWCDQMAAVLQSALQGADSMLEVGVGEATTLTGVLTRCETHVTDTYGIDASWSRLAKGIAFLDKNRQHATLAVGDIAALPFANKSIDVVYSSHSLEPNHGREEQLISECMRVARHRVVLVEPIYELASEAAQARMREHGYVRELRRTAELLGANVERYELLPYSTNSMNPSGVIVLSHDSTHKPKKARAACALTTPFSCPITGADLTRLHDCYLNKAYGIAYPILRGVPLLRGDHAVAASALLEVELQ